MSKLNPQNERIKRDFLRHQQNALGKSEATIDAMRKALTRFEEYTGQRDFKTFRARAGHRLQAAAGGD
jgi:site-specific recombinase XerD